VSTAKGNIEGARTPVNEDREWSLSESMRMDMGGGFDPYNRA
jgi:hypothetical protein